MNGPRDWYDEVLLAIEARARSGRPYPIADAGAGSPQPAEDDRNPGNGQVVDPGAEVPDFTIKTGVPGGLEVGDAVIVPVLRGEPTSRSDGS